MALPVFPSVTSASPNARTIVPCRPPAGLLRTGNTVLFLSFLFVRIFITIIVIAIFSALQQTRQIYNPLYKFRSWPSSSSAPFFPSAIYNLAFLPCCCLFIFFLYVSFDIGSLCCFFFFLFCHLWISGYLLIYPGSVPPLTFYVYISEKTRLLIPLLPPASPIFDPLSSSHLRCSLSMTMSYYEPQGWQAPAARQVSWEQPVPPSRSGRNISPHYTVEIDHKILMFCSSPGSSSVSQREDIPAFSSQFDGMHSSFVSAPEFPSPKTPKIESQAKDGGGELERVYRHGLAVTEYYMLTCVSRKEVDRAIDNLVKSGKLWAAPRRDSMPLMMGRPYPDYGMHSFRTA